MKTTLAALAASLLAASVANAASGKIVRIDHAIRIESAAVAPTPGGAKIYVREVVSSKVKGSGRGVVLFVHGAGTPAEVAFDVPYRDFSWMAYLARAGFDVFSMDMEGYGRSSRPAPMNDPCNLSREQQAQMIPARLPAPCEASFKGPITTIQSDWTDIDVVVDHLRAQKHVKRVVLIGWSQGGPRAGGYTAQHPDKVSRLVLLAPALTREGGDIRPANTPPMDFQSQADFKAKWDMQAPCPGQYAPETAAAIWTELRNSDPEGASWGPGGRRAPHVPSWGFDRAVVGKMTTPVLLASGQYDGQVPQERVRAIYAALASHDKVFIDLACSSHNAMWEKNHLLLFKASREWLTKGTVDGRSVGELRKGY